MKIALLSSTGASVARRVQQHLFEQPAKYRDTGFELVFTDRQCGAQSFAADFALPCHLIETSDAGTFSAKLTDALETQQVDYLILFFTRLLRGPILERFAGRLINFHPSLLPACPGQRGFEDTMASGALFFGSTVHWVDAGMDTGQPILQAVGRKDPNGDINVYRHQVFAQQVASLFQLMLWLRSGRLCGQTGSSRVRDANYQADGIANPAWEPAAEALYHTVLSEL